MKKSLALVLALVLAMAALSCAFAEENEVVHLTVYNFYPNPGTWEGFLNNYLEKTIGVRLDSIPTDNEKLQTMIAGNSLADIGSFMLNNSITNLIESDMLVNLEDYEDELPNLFEQFPSAVKYAKKMLCDEKGLYGMPVQIGRTTTYPFDPDTQSIKLMWNVYKEIGAPEINDWDDLIDVLGQMMEAHPTNEVGGKTYGMAFHGNNGSDIGLANIVLSSTGYMPNIKNSLLNLNLLTGEIEEMFADNGAWYNALKVIYKANQAGVLDPETLTQTYDQLRAKNKVGSTMSVMNGQWVGPYNTAAHQDDQENPSGYLSLYADWLYPVANAESPYGSSGRVLSIAKTCSNMEKAIELLNLLYDPYSNLVFYNGPQGELWDIDENGKLYATDLFLNDYLTNLEVTLSDGTVFSTGTWWGPYAMVECQPTPWGEVYRQTSWEFIKQKELTYKVYDLWHEVYAEEGWESPIIAYESNNQHPVQVTWPTFFQPMDDDVLSIYNAVKAVWCEDMYKMAFAANEEEFEAYFADLKQRTDALGIQQVYDWGYAQAERAQALQAEFAA